MKEKIEALVNALSGLNAKESVLFVSPADAEEITGYFKTHILPNSVTVNSVSEPDTIGDYAFMMSGVTVHIVVNHG